MGPAWLAHVFAHEGELNIGYVRAGCHPVVVQGTTVLLDRVLLLLSIYIVASHPTNNYLLQCGPMYQSLTSTIVRWHSYDGKSSDKSTLQVSMTCPSNPMLIITLSCYYRINLSIQYYIACKLNWKQ
jgi:hypothetical protein